MAKSNWFKKLQIDDYLASVQKYNPENVTSCPSNYRLSGLEIACGPLVRFLATHENEKPNYRGSILTVFKSLKESELPQLNFNIGPSNPDDELQIQKYTPSNISIIHQEEGLTFVRYSFELELQSHPQQVRYEIGGESLPHFKFYIPSKDQTMNVMSYSCNGFSLGTETATFKGSLWLDVLRKHENEINYHVMIGGGDQIYADSVTIASDDFRKWLKHRHLNFAEKLTGTMQQSFNNYYLNHYIDWFGKGYWKGTNGETIQSIFPVVLSTIPQINIYDDHDIIDGYGSYKKGTMNKDIFKGLGETAFKYYMLFQHHTALNEAISDEPSWIAGSKKGPYIKQNSRSIYARLGKSVAFLGLDCRTERTKHEVVTPGTYQLVLDRLQDEITQANKISSIKHLYILLGVPICYPRMVFIERIMNSPLIKPILFLSRKGLLAPSLVNEFDGEIELLDDLNDHWCAHHHKKERNELMRQLINFGKNNNVRITILSGDVHLACISRFRGDHDSWFENPVNDPNFMINLISSAIVNAPPPDGMVKLLSSRTKKHLFDKSVKEDMVPMFNVEPDMKDSRDYTMFMNKRNYSDLIPIENLTAESLKERYGESYKDKYYLPSPINGECNFNTKETNIQNSRHTNGKIGYRFDQVGVVATFHVEIDRKSPDSETGGYDILIPSLKCLK